MCARSVSRTLPKPNIWLGITGLTQRRSRFLVPSAVESMPGSEFTLALETPIPLQLRSSISLFSSLQLLLPTSRPPKWPTG